MTRTRTQALLATLALRPLQCDGATGTQLQVLGLQSGECCERWVTDHPDRVRHVHQRYLDAGADLLTTNTFGGTTLALAAHGLDTRAAGINRAAARLAREVAGERAWVLGDMGPFGGILEPYGETEPATAAAAFLAQAAALIEGGADALLVETMSDPAESALAIAAAREAGAELVIATFAFQRTPAGFRTMMGADAATAIRAALDAGATIAGANCGTQLSLDDYAKLTAELTAAAAGAPVIVQPNAGSPERDPATGRITYGTAPGAFADAAARYIALGARIVGGCCGTTPAHIVASACKNKKHAG
ncbi:MAG: homocysteine S-methyltransferase family protein [Opitutaceae bacterium]|jgi:5-methyltetrahydrofolate--homocysteine methyltransferase|nr:homocysteine S-methyltransferase family protein [Opitutaceae bacterium]